MMKDQNNEGEDARTLTGEPCDEYFASRKEFYEWFDVNYPPNCLISRPAWHASRIWNEATGRMKWLEAEFARLSEESARLTQEVEDGEAADADRRASMHRLEAEVARLSIAGAEHAALRGLANGCNRTASEAERTLPQPPSARESDDVASLLAVGFERLDSRLAALETRLASEFDAVSAKLSVLPERPR